MKKSTILCAFLAIVMVARLLCVHVQSVTPSYKPEVEKIYLEKNEPISGMFFSSGYVTEEYEYDDMYCIRYDDADANLFDVEIAVGPITYQSVIASIKSGEEMVGSLVLNDSLSCHWQQVFTFIQDSENF